MSTIGPLTRDIIDACVQEFKKKDTKDKISKYIIDPVVHEVVSRTYSYMFLFILTQLLIIALLIYIVLNK